MRTATSRTRRASASLSIRSLRWPTSGTDPEDSIQFRRVRLALQGTVLDDVIYKIDFEMGNSNLIQLRDITIGRTDLPFNQTLLIGNQKRPLNFDQWSNSNYIPLMERPLIGDVVNAPNRGIGVSLLGYTDDESINWQVGSYTLEVVANDGRVFSDPLQLSVNARVAGTPFYDQVTDGRHYLHLGMAGMLAYPNGLADRADGSLNQARFATRPELQTRRNLIDTLLIRGANWYGILATETLFTWGSFTTGGETSIITVDRFGTASTLTFWGAYVYASYFLTGEHQPLNRKVGKLGRVKPNENFFLWDRCWGKCGQGGWGAWQVVLRFSIADLSDDDVLGGAENNTSVGVNWWWNERARVMLNYVYGNIWDHRLVGGFSRGNLHAVSMRFQVDF